MRVLAALGVVALACAGTIALAGTAKEPRKEIKPAVQARAQRIAVRLSDLPGFGWKTAPPQSNRARPRCAYYNPDQSRLTENADYTSPDFTRTDGLYVSSSVGIFVSAEQAKTAFGLVARPELARCLGQSIVKAGAPGRITLRSAGKFAFPRYGDRSTSYRLVFLVENGGQQVPAMIDVVAIDKGRVNVALFFSSAGRPVPADMERRLAAAVTGRV